LTNIHPVEADLLHADRHTDIYVYDEPNRRFTQSCRST